EEVHRPVGDVHRSALAAADCPGPVQHLAQQALGIASTGESVPAASVVADHPFLRVAVRECAHGYRLVSGIRMNDPGDAALADEPERFLFKTSDQCHLLEVLSGILHSEPPFFRRRPAASGLLARITPTSGVSR